MKLVRTFISKKVEPRSVVHSNGDVISAARDKARLDVDRDFDGGFPFHFIDNGHFLQGGEVRKSKCKFQVD